MALPAQALKAFSATQIMASAYVDDAASPAGAEEPALVDDREDGAVGGDSSVEGAEPEAADVVSPVTGECAARCHYGLPVSHGMKLHV